MAKSFKMCCKSAITDFQTPKLWKFAFLSHYQISKSEENQNFELSAAAWFLQKYALKYESTC